MFTRDSSDDPDVNLLVDRKDEVGVLATYFSKLIQSIKDQNQTLEERVKKRTAELTEAQVKLQDQANRDYLTGLYNRRYFHEVATNFLTVIKRKKADLAVIMLDIDKFKNINDTYGHGIGDTVLESLATKLLTQMRESDVVARFGGEEFAILLPFTSLEGAYSIAEKLRALVEREHVTIGDDVIKFTISIGIACVDIKNESQITEALERADSALYKAKETGRNKVVAN